MLALYQFITRKEPFESYTNLDSFIKDVTREIAPVRPELPEDNFLCPKSLKKLAESCWDADPEKRPSFDRILQKFDEILIDCSIFDPIGKMFWMTSFLSEYGLILEVKWEEFENKWVEFFNMGEPFPDDKPYQRVFKKVLCQTENGVEKITLKHFGEIIGYYPALSAPGTDQDSNWISQVTDMLRHPWFWGDVGQKKGFFIYYLILFFLYFVFFNVFLKNFLAQEALCNKDEGFIVFSSIFSSKI